MGDSKIVRQLRFHQGASVQTGQIEAPVRGYGSGHQAQRPRAVVNSQTAPGAPDGPVGNVRGAPGAPLSAHAATASPHPHNGLTRRPGQINVTPGIGEDNVKVGRALAPSQRALEAQRTAGYGSYPPIGGASSGVSAVRSSVSPVVLTNGFTRPQRDLLDSLLDKFHDMNVGDEPDATLARNEQRAGLVELATETKAAIARMSVVEDGEIAAGDVEDIGQDSEPTPTPIGQGARPARAARVCTDPTRSGPQARTGSGPSPMGGTNPPGEVRIFAPNTQPFETKAGRQSDESQQ